jgi:hypothetical protein
MKKATSPGSSCARLPECRYSHTGTASSPHWLPHDRSGRKDSHWIEIGFMNNDWASCLHLLYYSLGYKFTVSPYYPFANSYSSLNAPNVLSSPIGNLLRVLREGQGLDNVLTPKGLVVPFWAQGGHLVSTCPMSSPFPAVPS